MVPFSSLKVRRYVDLTIRVTVKARMAGWVMGFGG
jgi:hypothetical protein